VRKPKLKTKPRSRWWLQEQDCTLQDYKTEKECTWNQLLEIFKGLGRKVQ